MNRKLHYPLRAALAMSIALSLTICGWAAGFPDVSGDHWAGEAIEYWAEAEVLTGYLDGSFQPEQSITRAEAAKVISAALNLSGKAPTQSFLDVPDGHWAKEYVDNCVRRGIFRGYGDGYFAPDQPISRQETMTVLYRAAKYTADDPEKALAGAADAAGVLDWAVEAVGTMIDQNVVQGYPDGTIGPNRNMTRAEFAELMYRIDREDAWNDQVVGQELVESVSWTGAGVKLSTQFIRGENYLFLPGFADLTDLELEIQTGEADDVTLTLSGDLGQTGEKRFDLTALASADADGSYRLKIAAPENSGYASCAVKILRSSQISSMFLTSRDPVNEGRLHVDAEKGNSADADMIMVDENGEVVYDGELSQLKSRGNSTFLYYPKKAYQIKLDGKTDLLGNGQKVKTWVLLASYADPTQFHDKLCKDLAIDMGMEGAPDSDWVDLYYDGEYRGTYLLSEKVDVGKTGLDITDLEGEYEDVNENYGDDVVTATATNRFGNDVSYVTGLTDPEDITDGYVVEMNFQRGDEHCWFKTRKGYAFNVKIPEDMSQNAVNYISEYFQEFEDAVYAVDADGNYTGVNPDTGKSFAEYCDLDSLARMYLIYTFSHNQDAYVQSTYFYMSGGKLYAGPIWDSDQVFGTGWATNVSPESELLWSYLVEALQEIPEFQAAVKAYYEAEFRDLALGYANEKTLTYQSLLTGTDRMNHVIWPVYYEWAGLGQQYSADTTYEQIIGIKRQWMLDRIEYMDSKFGNW